MNIIAIESERLTNEIVLRDKNQKEEAIAKVEAAEQLVQDELEAER